VPNNTSVLHITLEINITLWDTQFRQHFSSFYTNLIPTTTMTSPNNTRNNTSLCISIFTLAREATRSSSLANKRAFSVFACSSCFPTAASKRAFSVFSCSSWFPTAATVNCPSPFLDSTWHHANRLEDLVQNHHAEVHTTHGRNIHHSVYKIFPRLPSKTRNWQPKSRIQNTINSTFTHPSTIALEIPTA